MHGMLTIDACFFNSIIDTDQRYTKLPCGVNDDKILVQSWNRNRQPNCV